MSPKRPTINNDLPKEERSYTLAEAATELDLKGPSSLQTHLNRLRYHDLLLSGNHHGLTQAHLDLIKQARLLLPEEYKKPYDQKRWSFFRKSCLKRGRLTKIMVMQALEGLGRQI